jgi:hypothetical protein
MDHFRQMSVETKPQITQTTAPRSEQKSGEPENKTGFLTTLNVVAPFKKNIVQANPAITESDAKDAA